MRHVPLAPMTAGEHLGPPGAFPGPERPSRRRFTPSRSSHLTRPEPLADASSVRTRHPGGRSGRARLRGQAPQAGLLAGWLLPATQSRRPERPGARVPHEPSFLNQVPESVRGLVRGQYAASRRPPRGRARSRAVPRKTTRDLACAIVAMPGQSARRLLRITEKIGGAFPHLLVIPDLIGFASIGVPARAIAGVVRPPGAPAASFCPVRVWRSGRWISRWP